MYVKNSMDSFIWNNRPWCCFLSV